MAFSLMLFLTNIYYSALGKISDNIIIAPSKISDISGGGQCIRPISFGKFLEVRSQKKSCIFKKQK
jgi:hypothetical protein